MLKQLRPLPALSKRLLQHGCYVLLALRNGALEAALQAVVDHVGVVVVRVHVEEGKDLRDFFGGFDEVVEVSGVWRVTLDM